MLGDRQFSGGASRSGAVPLRGVVDYRTRMDPEERLRRHRYGDLVRDLAEEPSFLSTTMFGLVACYLHGRLVLALGDKRPPWRGVLVPTDRSHHAELRALVPALRVHPVLGKWLYLREGVDDFETAAETLVVLARTGDPRIGVESQPRRGRSARKASRARGRAARA